MRFYRLRSEWVLHESTSGCGCQNQWVTFFGVGEFTTHFRTYFSGDWDVHWGYDLDFDPWPSVQAEGPHSFFVFLWSLFVAAKWWNAFWRSLRIAISERPAVHLWDGFSSKFKPYKRCIPGEHEFTPLSLNSEVVPSTPKRSRSPALSSGEERKLTWPVQTLAGVEFQNPGR